MAKTILLTGASSFSGCHIAKVLVAHGHRVVGTLTRKRLDYTDTLIAERLKFSGIQEWIEEAPLNSARLLEQLTSLRARVFINHGASIQGYRKPDFDYLASVRQSTDGLEKFLGEFQRHGGERVIHSGSIFEPDEGRTGGEAISIYGVSKALTWQVLRFFCGRADLPLSKIIIPNPIGKYENLDRLGPLFVKLWKQNGTAKLTTPDLVRDQLPAPWLAQVYAGECEVSTPGVRVRRPSGYALSNEEFVEFFAGHANAEMGFSAAVQLTPQPTKEVLERINAEPVPELSDAHEEEIFWKDYLQWLNSLEVT